MLARRCSLRRLAAEVVGREAPEGALERLVPPRVAALKVPKWELPKVQAQAREVVVRVVREAQVLRVAQVAARAPRVGRAAALAQGAQAPQVGAVRLGWAVGVPPGWAVAGAAPAGDPEVEVGNNTEWGLEGEPPQDLI